LKVSSSAVAKTIKRYDETVSHEDRHWKGRPRVTSAAEDKFIRVDESRFEIFGQVRLLFAHHGPTNILYINIGITTTIYVISYTLY
jgi:hypothetical protein